MVVEIFLMFGYKACTRDEEMFFFSVVYSSCVAGTKNSALNPTGMNLIVGRNIKFLVIKIVLFPFQF